MGYRLGDWHYYSGAIHIHTTQSDGTRSLDEIIGFGQEVGLDYMMFADHMTLADREMGREGFYDKTLVLIGYEHNDLADNHHYLIFGSPGVYSRDMRVGEYVAAAEADNALGIMAHPDEIRGVIRKYRSYPWNDWSVRGFQAVEMWNQMSEWMEQLTPLNKLAMALSPRKSMVAPTQRLRSRWDEWNMHVKVAGIGSVDAHAFPIKIWPTTVEIFPYKVHFKSLRTHLILLEELSDQFERARDQVYDAIRDCRLYFSNMRWGCADGFEFYAENDRGKVVCGGELPYLDDTELLVKLPDRATIRIISNGQNQVETRAENIRYRIPRPGIYRVEVWRKKRGWIFSNHIRIGMPIKGESG